MMPSFLELNELMDSSGFECEEEGKMVVGSFLFFEAAGVPKIELAHSPLLNDSPPIIASTHFGALAPKNGHSFGRMENWRSPPWLIHFLPSFPLDQIVGLWARTANKYARMEGNEYGGRGTMREEGQIL